MDNELTKIKLERTNTKGPNVLDLFSGCGGLSLGFHRAGANIIAGIEIEPNAAKSHARNFHGKADEKHFDFLARARDITGLDPDTFMQQLGYEKPDQAIDLVVGGPPCPAFTRVGRAKLREVHAHPEAFRMDPRAKLYLPYLRFVKRLKPLALIMENVPDLMNFGGHNLAEEICDILEEYGYQCAYTLMNSANYGVPQMRERFILIAIHSHVGVAPQPPAPNRHVNFPPGYHSAREVALKHVNQDDLFGGTRYISRPETSASLHGPVTIKDAISDLPFINGRTQKRGARRFNEPVPYRTPPKTPYAELMRQWPGFEARNEIHDHVTRYLSSRDHRLFEKLKYNDDYPKAHKLAIKLWEEHLSALDAAGKSPRKDTDEYFEIRTRFVPPYDPGKFPNKWRKMHPNEPARTLMAHLGKDGYSHIHYDGKQARVISVREAARLQSFPDGFKFEGTMNPAFRQIGNAVPPMFAYSIAETLLNSLNLSNSRAKLQDARAKAV